MDPIVEENEDDEFQHDDTNFDDGEEGGTRPRSNSNLTSSFVRKLYDMVENESPDIISWLPDGLAFEVKDPKRLEAEVLPKFFRHSRFQSLVRQLNFYAFKKVSKERSSWVYSHESFQRDHPELLESLRRKTNRLEGAVLLPAPGGIEKRSSPGGAIATKRPRSSSESIEPVSRLQLGPVCTELSAMGDSNPSARKRSMTISDDVMHSWENVHKFFNTRPAELSPGPLIPSRTPGRDFELKPFEIEHVMQKLHLASTSPTAEAIISFCLHRNPWNNSSALFYDIFHYLTYNKALTDEINTYAEALSPSTPGRGDFIFLKNTSSVVYNQYRELTVSHRTHRSMSMTDYDAISSAIAKPKIEDKSLFLMPNNGILRENEATIMRAFMTFAVSSLHSAAQSVEDDKAKADLRACADIWQDYTQSHN